MRTARSLDYRLHNTLCHGCSIVCAGYHMLYSRYQTRRFLWAATHDIRCGALHTTYTLCAISHTANNMYCTFYIKIEDVWYFSIWWMAVLAKATRNTIIHTENVSSAKLCHTTRSAKYNVDVYCIFRNVKFRHTFCSIHSNHANALSWW